jgi:membrane protein YqaA with SNARE-associated domain
MKVLQKLSFIIPAKHAKDFISHKKFVKIKKYIKKHQDITVFIINLSTLPSPLVHFAAGMIKLSFWRTFIFSILGLTFKYLIILVLFNFSIIVIG